MIKQNLQKNLAIALSVVVALCVIGAIVMLNNRPPGSELPGVNRPQVIPPNGEITVVGTIECLPHRDTSGPQTMECAFGLVDDGGTHYALRDSDPNYANVSGAQSGGRVTVHGNFVAAEDEKYASMGTITVDRITPEGAQGEPQTPPVAGDSVSDGTISFVRPADFGLAVTPEQILVNTYIPTCEEGFMYCLYFNADTYEDTNFDGAGVGIRVRSDLTTEAACLTTQPTGYTGQVPKSATHENYAVSTFAPIGDAGAGHYSNGEQYRLFTSGKCYQFDAQVGESQFANYPAGSVMEFTLADRTAVLAKLRGILGGVALESGGSVVLP